MRIGPVTVGALPKRKRLIEIPLGVALHAIYFGVLAEQGELRFGMVKGAIQYGRRNFVPAGGVVAGLTVLRKAAAVRVGMAIGALAKCDSKVARLFVRPWSMALLAGNLRMQAGEGVARERMIELSEAERFPVGVVVTLKAIRPEPAAVLVLMTGGTSRRHTQECPVQVLDLDLPALACGHELPRVTLTTG